MGRNKRRGVNLMGLDMFMHATKYTSEYVHKDLNKELNKFLVKNNQPTGLGKIELKIQVGYWRKANQIHRWFVNNVQDGKDDCDNYPVSRKKLKELRVLCVRVLEEKDEQFSKFILPTQEGFFFGANEYDDSYYNDISETVEIIDKCLELPEEWDLEYGSSW